jgi:tetratricopeptide (TPR) repeat protein
MTVDAQALWDEGQRHIIAGRYPAARAAFDSLLAAHPAHVPARLLQASVMLAQGEVRSAAEQLKFAAFALPNDADTIFRVAQALVRVGETNAARACLQHPELARTRSAPSLAAMGHICQGLGLHEAALALMDRAKALGFDSPDFRYFRAIQLQFNGHNAQAQGEIDACLRMGPTFGRASLTLARLRTWTADENHLDFIHERLRTVPPGTEDHAAFEFAQYKELEDIGRYDEAFAALARGNAIMHARLKDQLGFGPDVFDGLVARFPEAPTQTHRFEGPLPIFIVGMPRSGTTLLERILGNHPQVASAGELFDFPRQLRWTADRHGHPLVDAALLEQSRHLDFELLGRRYLEQSQWRAGGKAWYVDKLPPNYLMAGFIARALPQAKILHMVRDPMDVCFSNYRALFGDSFGYSYDLATLAEHHRQYRRLMAHWHAAMPGRIHDVAYADLVTDTEATARTLLAHCGLDFDPACLDTAGNAAPVATLSTAQVREPIHARAIGEWQRYASQLQPLVDSLDAH